MTFLKPFSYYGKNPIRKVVYENLDGHDTSGNNRSLEDSKTDINDQLRTLCNEKFLTPHIAMERVAKHLAYYGIILNKHNTLNGDHGVTAFEVSQFGNKVGMRDDGKVVTKTDEPFMIYFEWFASEGYFRVTCKLVTQSELNDLLDLDEEVKVTGKGRQVANIKMKHGQPAGDIDKEKINIANKIFGKTTLRYRSTNRKAGSTRNPQSYVRKGDAQAAAVYGFGKGGAAYRNDIKVIHPIDPTPGAPKPKFRVKAKSKRVEEEQLNELTGKGKLEGISKHYADKRDELINKRDKRIIFRKKDKDIKEESDKKKSQHLININIEDGKPKDAGDHGKIGVAKVLFKDVKFKKWGSKKPGFLKAGAMGIYGKNKE